MDKLILVKGTGRSARGGDRRSAKYKAGLVQPRTDSIPPHLMTVKEAAAYLRVNKSTIYRLLNAGRLPGAFRVGSDWRILRGTLEASLKALTDLSYK